MTRRPHPPVAARASVNRARPSKIVLTGRVRDSWPAPCAERRLIAQPDTTSAMCVPSSGLAGHLVGQAHQQLLIRRQRRPAASGFGNVGESDVQRLRVLRDRADVARGRLARTQLRGGPASVRAADR